MEISKSAIDDLRDFMKSTFSNVAQTVDGLKQAVKKHNGRFAHYGDRKFVQDKMNEMEAKNGGNENAWIYSTDVINDLNKIKFGKSNIDSGWGELDAPGFRPGFDELDEENGLTVVWAAACGRGEWPVAFAVYVDNHKHLRAYIPEKGNVFDAKNKCALMKGTPQTYDMEAMRAQAKARIMVDESTKPKEEEKEDSTVNQNTNSPTPVHKKPIKNNSTSVEYKIDNLDVSTLPLPTNGIYLKQNDLDKIQQDISDGSITVLNDESPLYEDDWRDGCSDLEDVVSSAGMDDDWFNPKYDNLPLPPLSQIEMKCFMSEGSTDRDLTVFYDSQSRDVLAYVYHED